MITTTKRGVLWLGMTCDVRCTFCYQENMPAAQKAWVPAQDLELALEKFRWYYQDNYVDFMGGEPTYHPDIERIVRYSASIGLRPTLITHGMRLAERRFVEKLKAAGVHDFLVSVHGIGATARLIHNRGKNNFLKQMRGLANLRELGIPFRFNVTVVRHNLPELRAIAALAVETGASVVNFLTFNPYFEWSQAEDIPFQVLHSEAAPELAAALDILTSSGVEGNVRYFPLCLLPGREAHAFNGFQLFYDVHEWNYNSWYDQGHAGHPDAAWYLDAARRQRQRNGYTYADACNRCALREICDGVHEQYLRRFGSQELRPRCGPPLTDPTHFIRQQPHVVALPSGAPAAKPDTRLAAPLPLSQFEAGLGYRAGIAVRSATTRETR